MATASPAIAAGNTTSRPNVAGFGMAAPPTTPTAVATIHGSVTNAAAIQ
jgi:hypothetical protein